MWRKHPVTLHCCPAPHATGACCFTRVSFYLPSLSTLFSHKGESLEVSTSKRDDCQCGSSCGSLTVRSSLFRAPSSFIQILASCWRACQTSQEVLLHRETLMSLVTALKLICQINLFGMSYSLLFFFAIYLNSGGGGKCMTDIITSLTHFNLFSLQEAALLNQTTYLLMRVAVIIKKKWYWFICCAVFTSMKTNL